MASTAFTNQSDAAKTGLNLTLDPVERFITAGLQQKLYEVLGVRAGWLTSDDEQAVLQKLFGRENQGANDTSVQYPYGLLTMQSMAEAEDMGNIHAFSVRGLTAIVHDADARAYRVQLMPTDFDVRFKLVTNDYLQLLSVVTKLMHSRRRGWLKFNVVYGRITLAISVTPDANLTVPTKESTAGALAEYPLELNLKVKGYTSLPTLIEQQVVTKIEMSTSVQDNPEIGSDTAQVWAWTTAPMSAVASMTVNDNVPGVYVPPPAPPPVPPAVYENYGFFTARATGLTLGDLFSAIQVVINGVPPPVVVEGMPAAYTLPMKLDPSTTNQVTDAAFELDYLLSIAPNDSVNVYLGGGAGTVAPVGPMPVGTVRSAAPNPPALDSQVVVEADVPMRIGDWLFITEINQPVIGDSYSIVFVVGPDALNGERYSLVGPSFANTNSNYTLTRLTNVGTRSAA